MQLIASAGVRRSFAVVVSLLAAAGTAADAQDGLDHLFLCRSPLLANDFYSSLSNVSRQGVKLTPEIGQQICDHMRAGSEPQCIRVDARSFTPIGSGWGGMLAISDGKTRIWFHNPDTEGWIHPDYYFGHESRRAQGQR